MLTIVSELQHIQLTRRINKELCQGLLAALAHEDELEARPSLAPWMQTILEITCGTRRVAIESCVIRQLGSGANLSDRVIDLSHVLVQCRLLWRPSSDHEWLSADKTGEDGSLIFSIGSDADAVEESVGIILSNIKRFLCAVPVPASQSFYLPYQLLT
jgi:hypothetical protein